MEYNFKLNQTFAAVSGPGGWNDPDMLEIGNGGMTVEEEKTHFALWAIAKAPLIIGCDLTTLRPESLAILTNARLIAVNQDPASRQATCRVNCDSMDEFLRRPQVYATKTGDGATVATVVNWREMNHGNFAFRLGELGVVSGPTDNVRVQDLWTGETVARIDRSVQSDLLTLADIPGHGNWTLKITIESLVEDL